MISKGGVPLSKRNNKMTSADEYVINGELEIFGRSRTRDEIKAEQKELRAQEKAAWREAQRKAKEARKKQQTVSSTGAMIALAVAFAVVLVVGIVWVGSSIAEDAEEAQFQPSDTNTGHYYNIDEKPTLVSGGKITTAVNEIYYTKGGHLAVKLTLGNGSNKSMTMESLQVNVYQDNGTLIAGGYIGDAGHPIPANGYSEYTFYIRPGDVSIPDDPLTGKIYTQAWAVGK